MEFHFKKIAGYHYTTFPDIPKDAPSLLLYAGAIFGYWVQKPKPAQVVAQSMGQATLLNLPLCD